MLSSLTSFWRAQLRSLSAPLSASVSHAALPAYPAYLPSLHPVTRICLLCPPARSAFSSAPDAPRQSATHWLRQVNDLSRFKIGPSEVHGNGLMTTVDVPKGGTVGLHWFEVKPVPEQDGFVASYTLSFWPPTCTRLPGEEEAIANGMNGSAAPTQLLAEDTMLGTHTGSPTQ